MCQGSRNIPKFKEKFFKEKAIVWPTAYLDIIGRLWLPLKLFYLSRARGMTAHVTSLHYGVSPWWCGAIPRFVLCVHVRVAIFSGVNVLFQALCFIRGNGTIPCTVFLSTVLCMYMYVFAIDFHARASSSARQMKYIDKWFSTKKAILVSFLFPILISDVLNLPGATANTILIYESKKW